MTLPGDAFHAVCVLWPFAGRLWSLQQRRRQSSVPYERYCSMWDARLWNVPANITTNPCHRPTGRSPHPKADNSPRANPT